MEVGQEQEFDFLIVGSGFGGSISAMRLAQKGYSVAVLEQGKRFEAKDFPKSNWRLAKYFWVPILRWFGPQAVTFLKGIMVLRGVGVGGGSLIYASTLMRPENSVLEHSNWPEGVNWDRELSPHFDLAGKMLGVTETPRLFDSDVALKKLSEKMNSAESFHPTEVGIYFSDDTSLKDPYFKNQGPKRTPCLYCGGCMVGCRHNSKNTLDKNYLYFAEKWGAEIYPERKVGKITSVETGYEIETKRLTSFVSKKEKFRAKKVILSAGVLGTIEVLLKNKFEHGTLPNVSDLIGTEIKTNGESLLGTTSYSKEKNFASGVAIGSAFHPDKNTKIEAVRYPEHSGAMRLLAVPLTASGSSLTRPLKMLGRIVIRSGSILRLLSVRDWAKNSIILLVMQTVDQTLRLKWGRSVWTGFKKGLKGEPTDKPIPSYLPIAQEAVKGLSQIVDGEPQNIVSEVLLGAPATAHILGGCQMGNDRSSGVVNSYHEVFGHKGLYVSDGSVVPVNLGVNPSLTISALTERFASHFPVHHSLSPDEYRERQIQFS